MDVLVSSRLMMAQSRFRIRQARLKIMITERESDSSTKSETGTVLPKIKHEFSLSEKLLTQCGASSSNEGSQLMLNPNHRLVKRVEEARIELRHLELTIECFCDTFEAHLLRLEDLLGESEMLKCRCRSEDL